MAEIGLLHSQLFGSHGITAAFSMRNGGVSPTPFDSLNLGYSLGDSDENVTTNRKLLLDALGLADGVHTAIQVHGNDRLVCGGQGRAHKQEADILIASLPGTAVGVRTADCLPVLLADPVTAVTAAVHAGWRGTVRRVAAAAVAAMHDFGARPERIIATLGPAIGPCCFQVDRNTAMELSASSPHAPSLVGEASDPHPDLAAINRDQLIEAGLNSANIEQMKRCTCCEAKSFFSYRRDGTESGRMLAIVALPQRP